MLRRTNDLRGFELYATDGDIGRITEFYFDDLDWTVLYMVADSGAWLPGRRVLVSPAALGGETDWVERKMNLMVTRGEIEKSPEIDLHQPITREQEVAYFAHFGWACLWSGELRSTQEIISSQIITMEKGSSGKIEDLVVDDLWTIRYLIAGSENSDQKEKLLFSPRWIDEIDWTESKLLTSFESAKIQFAPVYDSAGTIKREYETELYSHYDAKPYWE